MNRFSQQGTPQGFIMSVFLGGVLFIQGEGIGFAIYFGTSALMDNYTIFFVTHVEYCKYVMAVAIYSMALVTFLPNCIIALKLQKSWYENGSWREKKLYFIIVMVAVTALSFIARIWIVYKLGWADLVARLENNRFRVAIAIIVPPIVDCIQALLLIASGLKDPVDKAAIAKERSNREVQEVPYDKLCE